MRNSILVLGCGHIGSAIAKMLSWNHPVTVIDNSAKNLNSMPPDVVCVEEGFIHLEGIKAHIAKADIVINAAPHQFNLVLGRMAVDANKAYFDMTEDVADTAALTKYVEEKGDAFKGWYFPQCGLAPGYVSILAADLCRYMDVPTYVHMRVGAIPQIPVNSLGYALTWSVDGLINEYVRPGHALRRSEAYITTPLEELEEVYVKGQKFEAFNTSGGVGTFDLAFPLLTDLNYKTIRYAGHCEKMRFLLNDLRMHPEDVKMALVRALPTTIEDMVVIKVVVGGRQDGKNVVRVKEHIILPNSPHAQTRGGPYTAIQLTTAQALCSVVTMFCNNQFPRHATGIVHQEDLELGKFLSNDFGALYA